ncbi:MAG: permease-like cell division protein FtsX [Bacteroidaceae bacterium]|nr:permease-like cell division protein FtsX [Bacteroidaceae bacterium]MBR3612690.1 permease-like cell division protein FtsX [Bacteroidaceae bacterium]
MSKRKSMFKVQTISVYISTTLVLLLLGVMGLLFVTADSLAKHVRHNLALTVVMKGDVSEADILKFKKIIDKKEYVLASKYISQEEVLQQQIKELGTNPVEFLGYNPYDSSIEISLKDDFANSGNIAQIEKELMKHKEVGSIIYQRELIDSINSNIRKISAVLFVFLVMLTIISWSLIGNLVRLSIYSKRFLMHTMKLVGATWGFIRRPFILHNMKIGLLAGIFANILLAGGLYIAWKHEPAIASILPLTHLAAVAVGITLFGVSICVLCAYLSVNSFLRMRSNDLYFL